MSRVVLCKLGSFGCHLIETRSLDPLLPVTTQVAVTQVVDHDEDNVGLPLRFSFIRNRPGAGRKKTKRYSKKELSPSYSPSCMWHEP